MYVIQPEHGEQLWHLSAEDAAAAAAGVVVTQLDLLDLDL